MDFFNTFLPFAIPTVAIGILAFIIIAIVQEAKSGGKAEAVRGAFTYVVSLVMLFIVIGSTLFLVQQLARETLFPKAQQMGIFDPPPPTLYLTTGVAGPTLYACGDACQFSDTDREQFRNWKEQYQGWTPSTDQTSYSTHEKRLTVNALSFLIVAGPLFWWFFLRTANRDAIKHREPGSSKPNPLRSAYFYISAFAGLVGMVVSGAFLLNIGLKSVLGIQGDTSPSRTTEVMPLTKAATSSEAFGVKSVINCAEKCGFTAEDKALAEKWISDYDAWQEQNVTTYPAPSNVQNDLANFLPLLLVTTPVFLYHFITIRRESKEEPTTDQPPSVTS